MSLRPNALVQDLLCCRTTLPCQGASPLRATTPCAACSSATDATSLPHCLAIPNSHLCVWLYETIVHPESEDEPEEVSCQKLPAAVMAAWRLLQQLQQQRAAAAAAAAPDPDPTASDPSGSSPEQPGGPASASKESSTPAGMAPTARPCGGQGAGAGPRALSCWPTPPPTELLHMQHSAFSAPFCTWRHVGPDELPPLHDVLVGVLRVCWERHDDREPSRNVSCLGPQASVHKAGETGLYILRARAGAWQSVAAELWA